MDAETLAEAMGRAPGVNYATLLPGYLNAARAAGITNAKRAAMWAAQLGHESVGLRWMEEIASGAAYEGRADLGNVQPGDGPRFRGRGPIQLTGRNNYRAFTRWAKANGHSDIDFEANPQRLSEPHWGFLAATYYWTVARPDINSLSDTGDLTTVTRRINGGTNGIADRQTRYQRCLNMGTRLLPQGGGNTVSTVEKRLDYPRDQVKQDTVYNCGPASAQTVIRSSTGTLVPEGTLGQQMSTHRGGTDHIGLITPILNRYTQGQYQTRLMPNDPPAASQREKLWADVKHSIDAGFGVVANIVAPPSNYPRPSYTSTIRLNYSGGTVYHYIAVLGYAVDNAGQQHVWIADSGFAPYGSWITLAQLASLIPPKGYATATAPVKTDNTNPKEDGPMATTLDTSVRGFAGGGMEAPLKDFILHADRNAYEALEQVKALRAENEELKALIREALVRKDAA